MVKLGLGTLRRDGLLFGESQSRVVLSVRPNTLDALLNRAGQAGVPAAHIGTVGGNRLIIEVEGSKGNAACRIDLPITQVLDRWAHALETQLSPE